MLLLMLGITRKEVVRSVEHFPSSRVVEQNKMNMNDDTSMIKLSETFDCML